MARTSGEYFISLEVIPSAREILFDSGLGHKSLLVVCKTFYRQILYLISTSPDLRQLWTTA
ncbi:hypothetical protein K443DRAFT_661704 [Laccaria amethystina LaAM-08-1]|uniref:Uncharacterized protein n=1 Tax=Laccaria amethystina LaAM-08-1 TaxID=1095629 RepID=A0A0C9XVA6_9AGAR|nr:hypothetical protein K443DRAFT_661704 [Laccaria amethystina LaAM-08-1]